MPVTSRGFSRVMAQCAQVSPSSSEVETQSSRPSPSGPSSAEKNDRPVEPTYQQKMRPVAGSTSSDASP